MLPLHVLSFMALGRSYFKIILNLSLDTNLPPPRGDYNPKTRIHDFNKLSFTLLESLLIRVVNFLT